MFYAPSVQHIYMYRNLSDNHVFATIGIPMLYTEIYLIIMLHATSVYYVICLNL